MQGTRVVDNTGPHLLKPGEYVKWFQPDGPSWHICTPNGILGWLKNHKCIEEEDGSLTVPSPGPGEPANSILCSEYTGKSWHGFMKKGFFKELG